jgi:hypothetical protein
MNAAIKETIRRLHVLIVAYFFFAFEIAIAKVALLMGT